MDFGLNFHINSFSAATFKHLYQHKNYYSALMYDRYKIIYMFWISEPNN